MPAEAELLKKKIMEDVCEQHDTTLVITPALRRAILRFDEGLDIGFVCFSEGETDGVYFCLCFFFQAEDGIRDWSVTGVQTCALPISSPRPPSSSDSGRGGACPRTSD